MKRKRHQRVKGTPWLPIPKDFPLKSLAIESPFTFLDDSVESPSLFSVSDSKENDAVPSFPFFQDLSPKKTPMNLEV